MANRRYELTDEQWERIKDMIQHSKMGQPATDDSLMLMLCFGLPEVEQDGKTYTRSIRLLENGL